jgi:hypothetical protein
MIFKNHPSRKLRTVEYGFYLSLIVTLLVFFFSSVFTGGYPLAGGDSFGHLYKIWKVWRSGYVSWAGEWYTGYPFARFYPPLTYLLGGFYSCITNSDSMGYTLVILSAMLLSVFTSYWAAKKLGMGFHESAVSSVVYAFSIWNLIIPGGGLPGYPDAGGLARYLATALAPLLPLAITSVQGGMKEKVAAGLVIGGLLLTHHTFFVTASYASLFIVSSLFILKGRSLKWVAVRRFITGTPLVFCVVLMVTAFWVIPFVADFGYSNFRPENTNAELYQTHSLSLENAVLIRDEVWITCPALIYHVMATATPLFALLTGNRRSSIASTLIAVAYWGVIGLSMGSNGPLTGLNHLPLLAMIRADRWSDALPLLAAFQAILLVKGVKKAVNSRSSLSTRNLIPLVWGVIIVLPSITVYPCSSEYTSFQISDELSATLQYISSHTQPTERFYQYGLTATEGSLIGYTPVLTGVKSVDGWYRQGDPLEDYRMELSWSITEAPQKAGELLDAYSVKHVLLDLRHPLHEAAYQGLTAIGFEEAFTRNPYIVMSQDTTAYLTPIRQALAIGDEWIIRTSLENPSLQVSYLGREVPEDLSFELLTEYDVVILQGYAYDSEDWIETIERYVHEGGIVIVDPYKSPDQTCNNLLGFGIKTFNVNVMGPLESIDSSQNESWICNYGWEDDVWGGCAFEDSRITDLLRVGPYTGVGLIQRGRGHIVLVGMNMLYHGLYTKDMRNIATLRTAVNQVLKDTTECSAQRVQDEHINLKISSIKSTTIRVSETWFPYWDVYVDGQYDGRPEQDSQSGVMVIKAPPGEHAISLIFNDPFIPLRYLSSLFGILAVMYLLIPETYLRACSRYLTKRIRERY